MTRMGTDVLGTVRTDLQGQGALRDRLIHGSPRCHRISYTPSAPSREIGVIRGSIDRLAHGEAPCAHENAPEAKGPRGAEDSIDFRGADIVLAARNRASGESASVELSRDSSLRVGGSG
jgi:hypothetical protein